MENKLKSIQKCCVKQIGIYNVVLNNVFSVTLVHPFMRKQMLDIDVLCKATKCRKSM